MRLTSPLVARTLSASRTGLRLTLNSRHSASSVSRCSGGYCQATTRSLMVATIDPLSVEPVDAVMVLNVRFADSHVCAADDRTPAGSSRRGLPRSVAAIAAHRDGRARLCEICRLAVKGGVEPAL